MIIYSNPLPVSLLLLFVTVKRWVETPENYLVLEAAFNSTTNYGKLHSVDATIAGRNVYLRFCCMSGDAMGMNMVSKGCLKAIEVIELTFPDSVLVAISGNMCTDKKPSAINWILGQHTHTHTHTHTINTHTNYGTLPFTHSMTHTPYGTHSDTLPLSLPPSLPSPIAKTRSYILPTSLLTPHDLSYQLN